MKYYVFLTANIYLVGGMQNYVEGKAAFLKKQGWEVTVFFCGTSKGECIIPALNEYVSGETEELVCRPGEWTKRIQKKVIDCMVLRIGLLEQKEREIIVESQTDILALWGELLARRIHAKHVCFICNELFIGKGKYYREHLDFFDFKHRRKELTGISEKSLENLFGKYKKIIPTERYHFCAAHEETVRDVECDFVNVLEKCDWNICYIGRAEKGYVEKIIEDISRFSFKHSDKQIQFLMVGNADSRKELLARKLEILENVSISLLGDMVPIPRVLFEKVDVVIAGAGCADCAAREHVPTIVADAGNGMANGVLGYTTWNTLFHDGARQMDFDEALEQVLVDKIQEQVEFKLPQRHTADYYYRQQMEFVKDSASEYMYYKNVNENTSVNYKKVLRYSLRQWFPHLAQVYRKMRRKFAA